MPHLTRHITKGKDAMGNELILDNIGTCRFCGQAQAITPEPGKSAEELAVAACDCAEARRYRLRAERVTRGKEMADALFGSGCEKRCGPAVPEEALQLIKAATVLIVDGVITKMSLLIEGVCKADVGVTAKGEIKVKRTEGKVYSEDE